MKISRITSFPLTAPYTVPSLPPDHWAHGLRNCVWLRIDTDEGLSGWGESYCGVHATEVTLAALRRLTRTLLGRDFQEPSEMLAEIRFDNLYWAARGIGAQCTSAIEAALWDVAAQSQGRPLWQVLGDGQPHPPLLYASAGMSMVPPDQIFREATDFVRQGFAAYKMRCGEPTLSAKDRLAVDLDRIAAAREALGPDRLLFVDLAVPQRPAEWDFARVASYAEAIGRYHVRFLEEPAEIYDVEMYRRIQALGLVPAAGGESFCAPDEFEPFFAAGALGVAQPDAAVVGGPASCVQVMRRARQSGAEVALHAWSAGVGLAQNLHAACSLPDVLVMEYPMFTHRLSTEPLRPIWKFHQGRWQPPSQPGLGVAPTPEFLRENGYQDNSERNF